MKYLRDIETARISRFILMTSTLILLLAFILPVPIVLFIQDTLYFSYDHDLFIRPPKAFRGMFIGLVWIAGTLLSFLFTKMYAEKKERPYKWTLPHILSLIVGIAICLLSIHHYYYFAGDTLAENDFFALTENKLSLNDVDHVSREVAESNYEIFSYTFTTSNNEITVPYDARDVEQMRFTYGLIDIYEWEIEDVFVDGE
ncbi:MAG TPA: hypothetical protein VK061_07965 [Bacillota bacterium]|nr:hypothetical protein [Bacillota bacterium]